MRPGKRTIPLLDIASHRINELCLRPRLGAGYGSEVVFAAGPVDIPNCGGAGGGAVGLPGAKLMLLFLPPHFGN